MKVNFLTTCNRWLIPDPLLLLRRRGFCSMFGEVGVAGSTVIAGGSALVGVGVVSEIFL